MSAESEAKAPVGERAPVHDLSSLLDVLQHKIDGDGERASITVREVLELIGRRAYGPLLLIIGLLSNSPATLIPGATWALAALALVVSIQLALHKDTPWMPPRALAIRLSEARIAKFIAMARPVAGALDKVIRPRFEFLADAPWVLLVALLCVLAAVITFPLGLIPFAPLVPGFAIIVFGLGLTARDGVLLTLGAAIMITAIWVLARVF